MRFFAAPLLALVFISAMSALAAPTTTTLAVTAGGSPVKVVAAGTVVTLTATVKAGAAALKPGQVKFCDASVNVYCEGSALLGTAQITSKLTASTAVRLALGNHSITAVFLGTHAYVKSVSAASTVEVQGMAGSSTTMTVQPTDATGSYSLGATVSTLGGGALGWPATGAVTFPDMSNGGKSLGTATLAAGSAGYGLNFEGVWSRNRYMEGVGDWNGDGYPDLLLLNQFNGNWYVSIGDGTGQFNAGSGLPYPPSVYHYGSLSAVADFNGDGNADLLITLEDGSQYPAGFEVLLGNGDGTFSAGNTYLAAGGIAGSRQLVGDFNGDGWPDVISWVSATNSLNFYAGVGDGSFAAPVSLGSGLPDVAVGDFNGDGKLDMIGSDAYQDAVVALGNGDGSFQTPIVSISPEFYNAGLPSPVIADFDGDGILDLAGSDGVFAYISYGFGDGTFGEPTAVPLSGTIGGDGIGSIWGADLNGDGLPDLLTLRGSDAEGLAFLNNGDGTFTELGPLNLAGIPNGVFAAVDVNGDGLPDLLASGGGYAADLLNTGGWESQAVLPAVTLGTGSGKHLVKASFAGDAGTVASSSSLRTPLWAQKIATTITLTGSVATVVPGGSVKLTATLAPSTSGSYTTNGEAVGFYSGGTLLGTGALAAGVATLTTTALPGGKDLLTAVYSGDNSFSGATSAALAITVTQMATTLTLSASATTATAQASPGVTFTATLSPASLGALKTDGEAVSFFTGTRKLGTGTLAGGVATLTIGLAVGTHSVTAVYGGDLNFAEASSAAKVVTVTKAATALTLTTGLKTVGVGNGISLTATLTPANGAAYPSFGSGQEHESVWFYAGKLSLGSGFLNYATDGSQTATIATTQLPLGTDAVTAVYTGDGTFLGTTSAAQNVAVIKDATTLTMGLAYGCDNQGCSFAYPGESVTLTASMSGTNNNGFPTGETVQFYNGITLLGTGTLVNEVADGCTGAPCATLTTSKLLAGLSTLTAKYTGDATFAAENSAPLKATVAKEATTSVLTTDTSSGIPGASVTLSVITTSAIPSDTYFSTVTQGELVSFYAGSKLLGTAPFSSFYTYGTNIATLTTTAIPTGSNSITAVYGGDVAYKGSTSNAVGVALKQTATSTVLIPAVATGSCGARIILNAQITSVIAGDPSFAGYGANDTVTFYTTTGVNLGTLQLTYGGLPGLVFADLYTTTLPCYGVYVYAVYSGDAAYSGSRSSNHYINLSTPLNIVWPEPEAIRAGTPLSEKQLNARADVPGKYEYSPKMGTVLAKGMHTLSVSFLPTLREGLEGYRPATKTVDIEVK